MTGVAAESAEGAGGLRYPGHWVPLAGSVRFALPAWWRASAPAPSSRRAAEAEEADVHPTHATFHDPETGLKIHWSAREQRLGVHPTVVYEDAAAPPTALLAAAGATAAAAGGGAKGDGAGAATPLHPARLRLWAWEPWSITWWVSQLFFWGSWLFVVKAGFALWGRMADADLIAASIALVSSYLFFLTGAYLLVVEALNTGSTVTFGYAVTHVVTDAGDRSALLYPLRHVTHHDQQPSGLPPRWLPPLHTYHVLDYVRRQSTNLISRSLHSASVRLGIKEASSTAGATTTAGPTPASDLTPTTGLSPTAGLTPAEDLTPTTGLSPTAGLTPTAGLRTADLTTGVTAASGLTTPPTATSSPDSSSPAAPTPAAVPASSAAAIPLTAASSPSASSAVLAPAPRASGATETMPLRSGDASSTPHSSGDDGGSSDVPSLAPQEREFVWWGSRWGEIGFVAAAVTLAGSTFFAVCNTVGLVAEVTPVNRGIFIFFFWTIELLASICFVTTGVMYTREAQPAWSQPQPYKLGWQASVWNLIGGIGFLTVGIMGAAGYAPGADPVAVREAIHVTAFVASLAFAVGSTFRLVETMNRNLGARALVVHPVAVAVADAFF